MNARPAPLAVKTQVLGGLKSFHEIELTFTSHNCRLDSHANNFERGRADIFMLETADIGELQRIQIRHNSKGFASDWHLSTITVLNISNNVIKVRMTMLIKLCMP